jgi:oligopeptide transport system permease protein
MLRFIFNRTVGGVLTLLVIVTLSFFLMRFAPGSPFDADRKLPPAVEANKWILYDMGEAITASASGTVTEIGVAPDGRSVEVGRDYEAGQLLAKITPSKGGEPIAVTMANSGKLVSFPVKKGSSVSEGDRLAVIPRNLWGQYVTSITNYAQLKFGYTIASDGTRTVQENLALALPISAELGLYALLLALMLGVSAGLFAGLKQNTWADYSVMSAAMVGISIPSIVSGPILIAVFILGMPELGLKFGGWDGFENKILPVITLSLYYVASFARLTRGGMLDIIHSDYIRTARAKGLSEFRVVTRHAFKGAILPTVTYLGPAAARIVTGSVVVEMIYNIPGLSKFFIQPALDRDYPMMIGVIVLFSALLIVMNLLVDIAYTFLDPRVKVD